jgi:hypothetical protein
MILEALFAIPKDHHEAWNSLKQPTNDQKGG